MSRQPAIFRVKGYTIRVSELGIEAWKQHGECRFNLTWDDLFSIRDTMAAALDWTFDNAGRPNHRADTYADGMAMAKAQVRNLLKGAK